jgi:hypothetical protein
MRLILAFVAVVELAAVALCIAANNPPRTLLNMPEGEYNEAVP